MKAKTVVITGLLLSAFGMGLVIYGNMPAFGEVFSKFHPQMSTSALPEEKLVVVSEETTGIGTYVIELTAPTKMASIQQEKVITQLLVQGATIHKQYATTVNAITISIDRQKIMDIASMPEVKRIYEDRKIAKVPITSGYDEYDIANKLHEEGYTGNGVMIFVIDTGINASIPQLQRNGESAVKVSYSTYTVNYTHWHGTFIANILLQVAPDADLGSVCCFDYNGEAWLSDILEATDFVARWHRQHPDVFTVVSCSFGVSQSNWHCGGWSDPCIICETFNSLADMGIPVVVAAGNNGPNNDINCPGQAQYVLTVGAVDANREIAWFSSRGPTTDGNRKPDVVAYGVNIVSVDIHGNEEIASGTSFSTPIVAGIVACMGEKYGYSYFPVQYYDAIRQSAEDLGLPGWDNEYGYGFVNGTSAINALGGMTPMTIYTQMGVPIFCIGVIMATSPLWRRK